MKHKNFEKIIIMITLSLLLIVPINAAPPDFTSNFSSNIQVDVPNGTYTGIMFNHMSGTISIWDIIYGVMAPFQDVFTRTGIGEGGKYLIFFIGWLAALMWITIQMQNTGLAMIAGIGTASFAAYLIPSYAFPLLTTMFAALMAAILYKLWIDR